MASVPSAERGDTAGAAVAGWCSSAASGRSPWSPPGRAPTVGGPSAGAAPAATPRRTRMAVAAGVLSLALLGGALAFAADRAGAGSEAEASVPATGTSRVAPGTPTGGRQVAPLSPGPPGVPGRVPATAAPPVPPSGTRAAAARTPSPPAHQHRSGPHLPDARSESGRRCRPDREIGAGTGGGSDEGAGTDPLAGADGWAAASLRSGRPGRVRGATERSAASIVVTGRR